MPATLRDGSFNPVSGATLGRCAVFCTVSWYTLAAVTIAVGGKVISTRPCIFSIENH
jgi:hypothetical protein